MTVAVTCLSVLRCYWHNFQHKHALQSNVLANFELHVLSYEGDYQARNLNREDAMDRSRWRKLIKDD